MRLPKAVVFFIMKKCGKCRVEKNLSVFSKDRYTKDGLRNSCKSCNNEYNKKYQKANSEKLKEQKKEYYKNNSEKPKKYSKEYRKANPEKIKTQQKEYYQNNKERRNEYHKNRRDNNPLVKLANNLRRRIRKVLKSKGWKKGSTTEKILGCSWEELKQHIEPLFEGWMTWENYGLWHIDHIIPLASAKTEEEMIKLSHYTNLQPLSAEDNLKKGCKII